MKDLNSIRFLSSEMYFAILYNGQKPKKQRRKAECLRNWGTFDLPCRKVALLLNYELLTF